MHVRILICFHQNVQKKKKHLHLKRFPFIFNSTQSLRNHSISDFKFFFLHVKCQSYFTVFIAKSKLKRSTSQLLEPSFVFCFLSSGWKRDLSFSQATYNGVSPGCSWWSLPGHPVSWSPWGALCPLDMLHSPVIFMR